MMTKDRCPMIAMICHALTERYASWGRRTHDRAEISLWQ